MEDRHRKILMKSRTLMVQNLCDVETVCDKLMELSILTTGMREEISCERTREAKIRKLLDIIPRRGRNAYDSFHQALVDTANQDLADMLRPELAARSVRLDLDFTKKSVLERSLSVPSPSSPQPKLKDIQSWKSADRGLDEGCPGTRVFLIPHDWPRDSEHAKPIEFTVMKPCREPNTNAYPMTHQLRGNVLIVNNNTFTHIPKSQERVDRLQLDATSLDLMFKRLNFKVKTHNNVTIRTLTEILEKESNADHTNTDCFILVIMSLGKGDVIIGAEGQEVKLDNIISCLDADHCPSLSGKPKIFIIQACEAVLPTKEQKGTDEVDEIGQESLCTMVSDMDISTHGPALRTDMFLARATLDRAVEFSDHLFGSWFIQAFVYIMKHCVHQDDLQTIMSKVNQLVGNGQQRHGIHKVVEYSSSLSKNFYFMSSIDSDKTWN